MALKITNVPFTVSPGKFITEAPNSGAIELQPISSLSLTNSPYAGYDDKTSLSYMAPSGELFFYKIELYNQEAGSDRAVVSAETGMGGIYPSGSNLYLLRNVVFENQRVGESALTKASPIDYINFDPERHLAVSSYTPSNYRHVCAGTDSVLCTTTPFQPEPIELDPSGILGRKSGQITSLTGQDVGDILLESSFLTNAAKTVTNELKWATNKFDLTHTDSLITANELRCKGTRVRPTSPAAGSIIFNEVTGKFEGYNGVGWIPIQFEIDQTVATSIEGLHWVVDGDTVILYDSQNNVIKSGPAVYTPL